ncbi:MAG: substrate-binding domain-containing protein [Gemmatimonadaceae bacterium]
MWTYENLAQNHRLLYIKLPDEIDLGNPGDSARYATASTRVLGKRLGDTLVVQGAPILFAVSIPTSAPHRAAAEMFVRFLLSADGQRILRATHFDPLSSPVVLGDKAPDLTRPSSGR